MPHHWWCLLLDLESTEDSVTIIINTFYFIVTCSNRFGFVPGKLERTDLLKARCAEFQETTDPPIPLSGDFETNLERNSGCWRALESNITSYKDTFRGRVCECPMTNGVQYKGDRYMSCEAFGPRRCAINNEGCWSENWMNLIYSSKDQGNELCGTGVGVRVAAAQYSSDASSILFRRNISCECSSSYLQGYRVLSANYSIGVDQHLFERILDPAFLDGIADTYKQLQSIVKNYGASTWVGEAGGAYNKGHVLVSNTFVYLDQLGVAATYDTKTYCRQTLVGGNYGSQHKNLCSKSGLLALLWHRLMGRKVLSTNFSGTKKLRAYAHCAKQFNGVTMLLINLDNNTTTVLITHKRSKLMQVSPGDQMCSTQTREEYHPTTKDGNLQSQTMVLNGNALTFTSTGNIPMFIPVNVNSSERINVAPYSIVFVHFSDVLPACKWENIWVSNCFHN